ncbi:type I-F CRISPR-associated protein Csy2, partial [Sulfurimonas sp.]|uniref:type I-F CRISPR-associated protein Csy2 n=1 Tax=Sulfurimonas sp. TaxID=2022749 RepID=UPI0019F9AC24
MTRQLLLLPHLEVHNANALSSPFTIGFPAMTAWLGATHALQRKLNSDGFEALRFKATGVVSHNAKLETLRGAYVHSIIGTGNPLDKDGNRPSFIEEARI